MRESEALRMDGWRRMVSSQRLPPHAIVYQTAAPELHRFLQPPHPPIKEHRKRGGRLKGVLSTPIQIHSLMYLFCPLCMFLSVLGWQLSRKLVVSPCMFGFCFSTTYLFWILIFLNHYTNHVMGIKHTTTTIDYISFI